jgi:hypothetical protein
MNTTLTTTTTTSRRPQERPATSERWNAALQRANAQGIQVRQRDPHEPCIWIVASATEPAKERLLLVVDGFARRCDCVASDYGDPVCLHRAAYYAAIGEPAPTGTPERLAA